MSDTSGAVTDELISEGERIRQKVAEVAAEVGVFVQLLREAAAQEVRERDE